MRQFYLFQKRQAMPAQLTWSHYCELLPLKDINEINYYIDVSLKQNLSYRQLRERIKSHEYQRLDDNTKLKLINKEEIIGIIIAKRNNGYYIEYSSDNRIYTRDYILS